MLIWYSLTFPLLGFNSFCTILIVFFTMIFVAWTFAHCWIFFYR